MRRLAFVMGSNGPAEYNPLRYALKDAERISACLSGLRYKFEIVTPKPRPKHDTYKLRRQLDLVAESCKFEDTFICYFSGHGDVDLKTGELFLHWDNTAPDNYLSTALPASDVIRALNHCKAHNKLLILDCCKAGAIESIGLKGEVGTSLKPIIPKLAENYLILVASGRIEIAREIASFKSSFLTANICSALSDNFDEVDKDSDNRLTLLDLLNWLEERVKEHNRQFPEKLVPHPYKFGREGKDFIFTVDTPAWIPYEIPWPDGSTMVVLPIRPQDGRTLCISKYPITNAQYKKFLQSIQGEEPAGDNEEHRYTGIIKYVFRGYFKPWNEPEFSDADKPVVCVSYRHAVKYCEWVNSTYFADSGYIYSKSGVYTRIPPPRLWDFAAFGTELPPRNRPVRELIAGTDATLQFHHNSSAPAPLDLTGDRLNVRGVSDMLGNVWEWCKETDWILVYPPVFAELRGGGFLDDLSKDEPFLQASTLETGEDTCRSDLGFRIAATVPIKELPKDLQIQLSLCRKGSKELWQQFDTHK